MSNSISKLQKRAKSIPSLATSDSKEAGIFTGLFRFLSHPYGTPRLHYSGLLFFKSYPAYNMLSVVRALALL